LPYKIIKQKLLEFIIKETDLIYPETAIILFNFNAQLKRLHQSNMIKNT